MVSNEVPEITGFYSKKNGEPLKGSEQKSHMISVMLQAEGYYSNPGGSKW